MDREGIHQLARLLGSKIEDRRGNVVIQCPMAPLTHARGTDRNPAMSIKVDEHRQSVCRCWACGTQGLLLVVMEEANGALSGLYEDAVTFVRENDKGGLAGSLARLRMGRGRRAAEERWGAPFDLVSYVARCTGRVPQYLIDRGVVRADVDRWRIGYDPETCRAVFPVWNEEGRLMGAARRTVLPEDYPDPKRVLRPDIKYHDTPGLPKEELFYGEHAIDPTREVVYLVEGILDAIFASRVLPNVAALMGAHTGIKDVRLHKLRRWARSCIVILDADRAGDEAWAGRFTPKGKFIPGLRDTLRKHLPVKVAHLPAGEDPASVPSGTLLDAVRDAVYLKPDRRLDKGIA